MLDQMEVFCPQLIWVSSNSIFGPVSICIQAVKDFQKVVNFDGFGASKSHRKIFLRVSQFWTQSTFTTWRKVAEPGMVTLLKRILKNWTKETAQKDISTSLRGIRYLKHNVVAQSLAKQDLAQSVREGLTKLGKRGQANQNC